MLLKAINKALANGMAIPEVTEVMRKCGYEMIVTTKVDTTMAELMLDTPPEEEHDEAGAYNGYDVPPPDGADFFDMAKRGVGTYRRATIRKLWNPNFVSVMEKLGSPLRRRNHA